jgi:hypothetical protein
MRTRSSAVWLLALFAGATSLGYAEPKKPAEDENPPATKTGRAKSTRLVACRLDRRAELLKRYGGTRESEAAVAAALLWLADHQLADGSWNFDHRHAASCQGKCSNPGQEKAARFGATGLALLAFLGAGQTHKDGEYKRNVHGGIGWLFRNMNPTTGTLKDGTKGMYSHAIATWAICEAYELSGDKGLLPILTAGTHYTLVAQDPVGGGWRYEPRQPGDLSVTAWVSLGLDSAKHGDIRIPEVTWRALDSFLDGVQSKDGAAYGYTSSGAGRATSAIGLLLREHRGWTRDRDPLKQGIEDLARRGPHKTDVYFNFFASQALFHYGGEHWKPWNEALREQLVARQSQAGHEKGSWYLDRLAQGNAAGGRLYQTTMCTLTLQTYYRYPRLLDDASKETH